MCFNYLPFTATVNTTTATVNATATINTTTATASASVSPVARSVRWKGENVATTQVAEVVGEVPGFCDVTIYGVTVPGCDGRVGMACVMLKDGVTSRYACLV
jgi:hypothetical protein